MKIHGTVIQVIDDNLLKLLTFKFYSYFYMLNFATSALQNQS